MVWGGQWKTEIPSKKNKRVTNDFTPGTKLNRLDGQNLPTKKETPQSIMTRFHSELSAFVSHLPNFHQSLPKIASLSLFTLALTIKLMLNVCNQMKMIINKSPWTSQFASSRSSSASRRTYIAANNWFPRQKNKSPLSMRTVYPSTRSYNGRTTA